MAKSTERGRSRITRMADPVVIKTLGYIVSTVSVVLLGIVSLKSASSNPLLAACLGLGMLSSIVGMALRWLSYQLEK